MSKSSYTRGARITSIGLATLMALTMAGCTLNKRNNENKVNNATVITTIANNYTKSNVVIDEPEPTTVVQEVIVEEIPNISYEKLMENFNNSIEKYDSNLQEYLNKIFSIAYNNADELLSALSPLGFPSKEAFLNEKLVKPLAKLDFFRVVKEEDDDFDELRSKYQTSRYVKDENGIYVFVADWNQLEQVQVVLEEIIHAGQDYLIDSDIDAAIFEILTEGEANLYAWILAFGNINNDSLDFFYHKNNNVDLYQMYGAGHHDHSIASKYYSYLLSLTDYNTLNSLKKNNVNMAVVANKISRDNGIDGEKFIKDMSDVMVDAATDIHDGRTDIMLRVEKTYNECMLKKVSNLTTKQQAIDYIRMYRFLNLQLGTRHSVHYEETNEYKDETDKDPNLSRVAIENKLFELSEQYGILNDFVVGVPEDKETRNVIFKTLVDSPRPEYDGYNFYSPDIFASKIEYDQSKKTLTIENQNGSGCVININTKKVDGKAYVYDIPEYKGYGK